MEVMDMLSQLRGEVVPTVLTVQRLVLENSMAVEMSSKLSQEKLELDEGLEDMQAMQKVEEMASRRMPAMGAVDWCWSSCHLTDL